MDSVHPAAFSRLSLAAAAVSAAVITVCIPVLTDPIFGRAFGHSVPASLILVPGQYRLERAMGHLPSLGCPRQDWTSGPIIDAVVVIW